MKVTDKRMFTPDGELREEYRDSPAAEPLPEGPKAPPTRSAAQPVAAEAPPDAVEPGTLPPPGFLELVDLLAQPILLYLGDLALPDGKSAENLALARMHIDLLDVLKDKTRGNLTDQEQAIVDDLLYRLRLRYVQKTT